MLLINYDLLSLLLFFFRQVDILQIVTLRRKRRSTAREGIQLDPNQIVKNPGLRALAKLMLNSFWGEAIYKMYTNSIYFSREVE